MTIAERHTSTATSFHLQPPDCASCPTTARTISLRDPSNLLLHPLHMAFAQPCRLHEQELQVNRKVLAQTLPVQITACVSDFNTKVLIQERKRSVHTFSQH